VHVLVYVTDDGSARGCSPTAFLAEGHGDKLPGHPNAMRWRYHATIGDGHRLLDVESNIALRAIQLQGFFISDRGVEDEA